MPLLTPMLHVPDVIATAAWYQGIGFELLRVNEDCGEVNWAMLAFGPDRVMLSLGGQPSEAWRRDVDLYLQVDDLDMRFELLRDRVEVVEPPHETEYGMREFIIRDLNRFWITFGQPAGAQAPS